MVYTLRFFPSKCSLFHNSNIFGSCFIHILYTECAKIKKKKYSGAKRLHPSERRRVKDRIIEARFREVNCEGAERTKLARNMV